jgi:hypothetical protein
MSFRSSGLASAASIGLELRGLHPRRLIPAPPSCCRPATPKLCSFTSMRSQPKSLRALTLSPPRSSRRWHGALKVPSKHLALAASATRARIRRPRNIWQFMRQNWLSNRIFKSFDDIVDAFLTLIFLGHFASFQEQDYPAHITELLRTAS